MVTSAPNAYQKYLKTTVETASQPQLLLMLFDAALKKLRMARKAIEENNVESSHNELIKAQKIFSELMVALDFEIGGELAHQLFAIYDFVYRQLVQANIRREVKLIDGILPIVEDLREGWTKAVAKYEEEERNAGDVARAKPTARQEVADEGSVLSGSEESQDTSSAGPGPQSGAHRFTAISPARYAKTQRREYTTPSPPPNEPPPKRLNVRG